MDEQPWMSEDLLVRLRWWAFKFCGKGEQENFASDAMSEAVSYIEKLEAALEKISRERTLWGAMRKADHALGRFEKKHWRRKMTNDMGFDLKLPAVGELTFPQWQDWLARYNAVLAERDSRIEKLEEALRELSTDWDCCAVSKNMKLVARKALEGKNGA